MPALLRIAELAPTLKEGELRVLIAMAVEAKPPLWTLGISSRNLANATGCSRRNIQSALDNLAQRNIITVRRCSLNVYHRKMWYNPIWKRPRI